MTISEMFKKLAIARRLDETEKQLSQERLKVSLIRTFITTHTELFQPLEESGLYITINPGRWADHQIDIHDPSREIIRKVMRYFAKVHKGVWEKSYYQDKVSYSRAFPMGKHKLCVRLYNGTPPENCRVVEEQVWIEAQVVPGHYEVKRSLKCGKDTTP